MKLCLLVVSLATVCLTLSSSNAYAASAVLWPIQSVDTMKISRDMARNPKANDLIKKLIDRAADLHLTHVAIATPYDDEFVPYMQLWVSAIRMKGLKVWFRGNFSGWEGWFEYPKFASYSEHNTKTARFIGNNADLFADGDIFTPAPEAENGGLGDPRGSKSKAEQFNAFLVSSYNNCVRSFEKIHKVVSCGYFSTNGDVARDVITPETTRQTGNVIVIDHYVKSAEKMATDLDALHQKFGGHIVLGEFGAPIPDINGTMTDIKQRDFIESLLKVLYQKRSYIEGINYWTLWGGSTTLLTDDGIKRPAFKALQKYFTPVLVAGSVTDTLGKPLAGVTITPDEGPAVLSNGKGQFAFPAPAGAKVVVVAQASSYQTSRLTTTVNEQSSQLTMLLTPERPSIFYQLKLLIKPIKNILR